MTNFCVYDIILCLAHGESAIPRRGYELQDHFEDVCVRTVHRWRVLRRTDGVLVRGRSRADARADGRGGATGTDRLRPVAGDGQAGGAVPRRDRQTDGPGRPRDDRDPGRFGRAGPGQGRTRVHLHLGQRQLRAHQHGGTQDRGSGDPRGLVLEGRNPLLSKREAGLRQDRTAGWVLAREICQPDRHPTAGPELGGSQRT